MSTDPQQTWREIIDQKVNEALAEVHAAADAELKGLFEEAFKAGEKYQNDLYWGAEETDFETWFAALVERLRNS